MHRNIAEDEFSSDGEHSDIELDDDEDLLSAGKPDAVGLGTYDHQSKSNAGSVDDEENLPGPPSGATRNDSERCYPISRAISSN